jgi:putative tryptophan/tyrosine transport system substrate-binding protein
MKTLALATILAISLLAAPPGADAQQSARLGILLTGSPSGPTAILDAFLRRLAEFGWVEGRTLVVERRRAEHPGQFPALAAELVALKVNVILTPGPQATSAAKAATTSIPIVMIASTDPVAAGLVANLARPGGNLTGVTVADPELITGKRLEILTQAIPGRPRVAALWDASVKPPGQESTDKVDAEASRLGLRLHHAAVRSAAEFEEAFRAARASGAGAVLVVEKPLFTVNATLVAEYGVKYRLPVMTLFSQMVERGALISYGPDLTELFPALRGVRGQDPARRDARQPSDRATQHVRTRHQAEDRQGARHHHPSVPPAARGSGDRVASGPSDPAHLARQFRPRTPQPPLPRCGAPVPVTRRLAPRAVDWTPCATVRIVNLVRPRGRAAAEPVGLAAGAGRLHLSVGVTLRLASPPVGDAVLRDEGSNRRHGTRPVRSSTPYRPSAP